MDEDAKEVLDQAVNLLAKGYGGSYTGKFPKLFDFMEIGLIIAIREGNTLFDHDKALIENILEATEKFKSTNPWGEDAKES